jgi:hypothetical protein
VTNRPVDLLYYEEEELMSWSSSTCDSYSRDCMEFIVVSMGMYGSRE